MLYTEICPKVRRHNALHITWTTQYYCINNQDQICIGQGKNRLHLCIASKLRMADMWGTH
jgi:hypothetical protein